VRWHWWLVLAAALALLAACGEPRWTDADVSVLAPWAPVTSVAVPGL
jgi:hypothetical protein